MANQIAYWEDVGEGTEIPPITLELTHNRIIMGVCATRDNFPLHHDAEFARASGYKGPAVAGAFLQGFLGRCVTDWAGPTGKLRKLTLPFRTPNCQGDTITASGKITRKYVDDGDHKVDCDLIVTNQDGIVTVNAQATVGLPTRA
jgi:acyl dehydratase